LQCRLVKIAHLGSDSKPRHAPFAELVKVSPRSIADEMREEHRRRVLGELGIPSARTTSLRSHFLKQGLESFLCGRIAVDHQIKDASSASRIECEHSVLHILHNRLRDFGIIHCGRYEQPFELCV
jgi:hypothetical protein